MIDQVVYTLRCKVGKDRHHDSLIGIDRQKRHSHSRGIFGADGYAVAFLQSTCLEKDVETLNLSCKLAIGERLTSVVAYSRLFPIKSDSILKSRKIMFHSINIFVYQAQI